MTMILYGVIIFLLATSSLISSIRMGRMDEKIKALEHTTDNGDE